MIETERLILRHWKSADFPLFAELNADAEVRRYFPSVLSAEESNASVKRIQQKFAQNGWGFWAVELKATGRFIGMVGLNDVEADKAIPETPFIEIAWRLARNYWGNGYASEAATAALNYGFDTLGLTAIYAFTALENSPSQRLMQKLGMMNTQQNFNHPKLPKGHRLERHCLYKIERGITVINT